MTGCAGSTGGPGASSCLHVYVTQELQRDGSRRLHHHLIISATGAGDYDTIRALWPNGSNVEIIPIGETEMYVHDDFLELAQYLLHERNPDAPATAVGDRGWNASRNLRKPVEESEMVDETVTVTRRRVRLSSIPTTNKMSMAAMII
mgnify:CR=1 FL=1